MPRRPAAPAASPSITVRVPRRRVDVGHDYDPEWEYALAPRPSPAVVALVGAYMARHAEPRGVLDRLGLPQARAAFVRLPGRSNHLARYVHGTAPSPVFVLDASTMVRAAKEFGVDLATTVESTLLHEYGHAWVDSAGAELDPDEEEALVERFAYETWRTADLEWTVAQLRAEAGLPGAPTRRRGT